MVTGSDIIVPESGHKKPLGTLISPRVSADSLHSRKVGSALCSSVPCGASIAYSTPFAITLDKEGK